MLVTIALLISTALATPETVEKAQQLHLLGLSAKAAEMLVSDVEQDPAAAMTLGRIFFTHAQWALSEAAYHKVPQESPLWFRSRLEATWAAYYLDPTHERAIARALLLYTEAPTDRELRYLIGVLVLHCGQRAGGVGKLTYALLKELVEDLKADLATPPPPQPSSRLEDLQALHAEGLIDDHQLTGAEQHAATQPGGFSHSAPGELPMPMTPRDWVSAAETLLFEFVPCRCDHHYQGARCGWESLGMKPSQAAMAQDNAVTRAIILTLGGEQERQRADHKPDRQARRWLRSYRKDLD